MDYILHFSSRRRNHLGLGAYQGNGQPETCVAGALATERTELKHVIPYY